MLFPLHVRSFKPEMSHGANNGLPVAMNLIKPVKEAFPELGWADLIQLASAVAIEVGRGAGHGRRGAPLVPASMQPGMLEPLA